MMFLFEGVLNDKVKSNFIVISDVELIKKLFDF